MKRPKRINYDIGEYGNLKYLTQLEKYCSYLENKQSKALQLHKTQVSGSAWIEVLSDHELTDYAEQLKPIWIILEDDGTKTPILVQPNGNDDFHGEDDNIYHYCDISHFMKIERPVF